MAANDKLAKPENMNTNFLKNLMGFRLEKVYLFFFYE